MDTPPYYSGFPEQPPFVAPPPEWQKPVVLGMEDMESATPEPGKDDTSVDGRFGPSEIGDVTTAGDSAFDVPYDVGGVAAAPLVDVDTTDIGCEEGAGDELDAPPVDTVTPEALPDTADPKAEAPSEVGTPAETPPDPVDIKIPERPRRSLYVPQFKVVERGEDPGVAARAATRCETFRDNLVLPGEVPLTDAERQQLARVHAGIVKMGDRLGVDLRDRLRPQHHHVFETVDDYQAAMRSIGKDDYTTRTSSGSQSPDRGVCLTREQDETVSTSVIAHEYVHDVSIVGTEKFGERGSLGADGRYRTDELVSCHIGYVSLSPTRDLGFNEWVTDMAMREVVAATHSLVTYRYAALDAIGTAAVLEAASGSLTAEKIEDHLLFGLLTGDTTGVEIMEYTLGSRRMGILLNLPDRIDLDGALEFAYQLNLLQAVRQVQSLIDRAPLQLFGWFRNHAL